jgi:selenocysteine-specific elongation factor
MKHFIIGTAGHVDHGKTMLVKALTGQDTDRLKEEKERGISIELGFAPFLLPGGILAGVVDVPGHERFIKNMLAGAGGLDMVLLVIAADEGIMPQTREHLDIIDLLSVQEGIIVITKSDLVEDDWIDLVTEEIAGLVKGTVLEGAPVVRVSSVTGTGLEIKERSVFGQARMPVDRVFSKTGFGTVLTGTLLEGCLATGETVEIMPQGLQARVRGLQVHGRKVEVAEAGQRVAVNLAGIDLVEVHRGSVLAAAGLLKTSHRIDIKLKLLTGAPKALVNRARVRVHIGTAEVLARVILLENEELKPGDSSFAQLEFEEVIVTVKGERLVMRSYSPMRTIGGGVVIDPLPPKHKRFNQGVIEALKTREKGTPEELLRQFMESSGQLVFSEDELTKGSGLEKDVLTASIDRLKENSLLSNINVDNKPFYVIGSLFNQKAVEMMVFLDKFHTAFPLRPGGSKEEIRSKLFAGINNKIFNVLLDLYQKDGIVKIMGENIAKSGFFPGPGSDRVKIFKSIETRFLEGAFQPSGWDEIAVQYKFSPTDSEEILNYFSGVKILIKLDDGVVLHRKNLELAKELIIKHLEQNGEMSLGEARDLLKTSRKFALPIMSYFDKEKITRRIDDKRVLY